MRTRGQDLLTATPDMRTLDNTTISLCSREAGGRATSLLHLPGEDGHELGHVGGDSAVDGDGVIQHHVGVRGDDRVGLGQG